METNTYKVETSDSEGSMDLISVETPQTPDRFFRITKVVPSERMLDNWVEWFKLRKIPCAITKGNRGYSLWRGGEEIGGSESVTLPVLRKKKIVYSFGL